MERPGEITMHPLIYFFFQENGFVQIHTPVITSNDCEGAGELFYVEVSADVTILIYVSSHIGSAGLIVKCWLITLAWCFYAGVLPTECWWSQFLLCASLPHRVWTASFRGDDRVRHTKYRDLLYVTRCDICPFIITPCVYFSSALSRVYTFGPTFRAENSQSRRHLAEFYMVEAEVSFTQSIEDLTKVHNTLNTEQNTPVTVIH